MSTEVDLAESCFGGRLITPWRKKAFVMVRVAQQGSPFWSSTTSFFAALLLMIADELFTVETRKQALPADIYG